MDQLKKLEINVVGTYIALIDMGFMWRVATPLAEGSEEPDNSQFTWTIYTEKLFHICNLHRNASNIVSVSYIYDVQICIKDSARDLRSGHHGKKSPNVYMKDDMKLPSHKDFSQMFLNRQNVNIIKTFSKNTSRG